MNEVRPTYVMGVPRTWEKIVAHVQVEVDNAGFPGKRSFRARHLRRSQARAQNLGAGIRPRWYLEAIYWPLWVGILGLRCTRSG